MQACFADLIRRQRQRKRSDEGLPAWHDVFQLKIDRRHLRERPHLERHCILSAGDQALPDVDVALADDRRRLILVNRGLDAPVTCCRRHPHHTSCGEPARRHRDRGVAHKLKRHADPEVGDAEREDGGVGFLRIEVDHLRAHFGGLACDRRYRLGGDFLLRIPGPIARRERHRDFLRRQQGRRSTVIWRWGIRRHSAG